MPHLTAWRGIAIIAVLILHFIPGLLPQGILLGPYRPLIIIIDQLMRFCVPLFVALSGYSLALKYTPQTSNWAHFFKRRVFKLLPLFILWSCITAYLYNYQFSLPLLKKILWGVDYQLYFVPMIVMLYLLFPIIQKMTPKNNSLKVLLCASLITQICIYLYYQTSWNLLPGDQLQYHMSFSWIFYFVLGISLARLKPKQLPASLPLITITVLCIGTLTMIITAWPAISNPNDTIALTKFTRLSVIPFATAMIMVALIYSSKIHWPRIILWLGKYSYILYLSHVILLSGFQGYLHGSITLLMLTKVFLVWILGIMASKYIPQ